MYRIQARRAHRQQVVFCSPPAPPAPAWLDDQVCDAGRGLRARMGRVVRRGPVLPLGGTVVRPVGDALAAVQAIRSS